MNSTTTYGPDNLRAALDRAEKARVRFHPQAHPESYQARRLREKAVIRLGSEPGGIWELCNRHRHRELLRDLRTFGIANTHVADELLWMLETLADMLANTVMGGELDREAQKAEWFGSGRTLTDALQTAADIDRMGFLGTDGVRLVADAAQAAGLDVTPRTPHACGALATR
jgi:hypothetical protein